MVIVFTLLDVWLIGSYVFPEMEFGEEMQISGYEQSLTVNLVTELI